MKSVLVKIISSTVLVAIMFTQIFGVYSVILPVEKAQAQTAAATSPFSSVFKGISFSAGTAAELTSVPTVERFNWQNFLQAVFEDVMMGVAYSFAQYFMQRFVDKVIEKYKIRNFLYYDQILSNYYLTNFIRDRIDDPDLREIYVLLETEFVLGQPTGTNPGSSTPGEGNKPFDQRNALIPRLKKAIYNLYAGQTGVNPELIANPSPTLSVKEQLRNARVFYMNPVGYTESRLRSNFGEFQSDATTAAQLEVIVGNGLKAGRWVGGYCEINGKMEESKGQDSSINTPEKCRARGGVWRQSALDEARSFIDNPTAAVKEWMSGVINRLTDMNFNPENFWFVIGNAFGRFLTNRLFIDKAQGVLQEDPRGYDPVDGGFGSGVLPVEQLDIDNDGIVDGYDNDGDGNLDYCIYGGTPPACKKSSESGSEENSGPPPPPDALERHPSQVALVAQIKAQLSAEGFNLTGPCGAFEIVKRVAWELREDGAGLFKKDPGQNQCNGYGIDVIIYDDGYVYDILGDAGGANTPQWVPLALAPLDRYADPINPNPTCSKSSPLINISLALNDIIKMANGWNFNVQKITETGYSQFFVNENIKAVNDLMDDTEVIPYKIDLQEVGSELIKWTVFEVPLGGDIEGEYYAILTDETKVFLNESDKQTLNNGKAQLINKTRALLDKVVQDCN